jgi:hypothetical protein
MKQHATGKDFGAMATVLAVAEQEPIGKFNIVGFFPVTKQLINMFHGHVPRTRLGPF